MARRINNYYMYYIVIVVSQFSFHCMLCSIKHELRDTQKAYVASSLAI